MVRAIGVVGMAGEGTPPPKYDSRMLFVSTGDAGFGAAGVGARAGDPPMGPLGVAGTDFCAVVGS